MKLNMGGMDGLVGSGTPPAMTFCSCQPPASSAHFRRTLCLKWTASQWATMNSEVDSFCGEWTLAENPGWRCSVTENMVASRILRPDREWVRSRPQDYPWSQSLVESAVRAAPIQERSVCQAADRDNRSGQAADWDTHHHLLRLPHRLPEPCMWKVLSASLSSLTLSLSLPPLFLSPTPSFPLPPPPSLFPLTLTLSLSHTHSLSLALSLSFYVGSGETPHDGARGFSAPPTSSSSPIFEIRNPKPEI